MRAAPAHDLRPRVGVPGEADRMEAGLPPVDPQAAAAVEPGGRLAAVLHGAAHLVRQTDGYTAVARGDDTQFLTTLRQDALPTLQAGVAALLNDLQSVQAAQAVEAHFGARLRQVDSTLQALQATQPLAVRVAAYLGMNTVLPALPLAVATVGGQQQYAATLVGYCAKSLLMALGSARSPTATNRHSLLDHFMARHFNSVVQGAVNALPTFVSRLHGLNGDPAFHLVAGALATGALFGGFFGPEIKAGINNWRTGSPHPGLRQAGEALTPQARDALARMKAALEADRASLLGVREDFTAESQHGLSPYTSKQITLAANAYLAAASELGVTLGEATPMQPSNPDRSAKLAIAAVTGLVCATTTALMYPDAIGMAALGSSAVFTTSVMLKAAANPGMRRRDALEEFKSFASLSLVLVGALAANRAAGGFIEHHPQGLLVGSLALAALNVTIPGPVGHLAANGIEKLMNLDARQLVSTVKAVNERVLGLFRPAVPAAASMTGALPM